MELKLYFSEEEIISFLKKNGYTIKTTETWERDEKSCLIMVAHPSTGDFDDNLLKGEKYSIKSKYGINAVFKKIIKEKILNL